MRTTKTAIMLIATVMVVMTVGISAAYGTMFEGGGGPMFGQDRDNEQRERMIDPKKSNIGQYCDGEVDRFVIDADDLSPGASLQLEDCKVVLIDPPNGINSDGERTSGKVELSISEWLEGHGPQRGGN